MMSLNEFKSLNRQKGFHWFDQGTLSFFRSRVSNWDCVTGYFISSERGPDGYRKYSVRKADFETGNVSTVGGFFSYPSIATAKTTVKRLRGVK